jgi:hypothetical protein
MTQVASPSIISTAIRGWQDAFAALSRMPAMFGIAIAALCILNILTLTLFTDALTDTTLGAEIVSFLFGVVQGFLLTPLAIAIHRFVLLDETANGYALSASDPRFMRFFLFTVLVQILMLLPSAFMAVSLATDGTLAAILSFVFLVLFIVVVILMTRMLILFPAIAVDAPGAAWSNALADSKGHSWRIFFIVGVTGLPAIMIAFPVVFMMLGGSQGSAARIAVSLIQSVVGALSLAAFAAVASHLYAAFAARLGRPAGL